MNAVLRYRFSKTILTTLLMLAMMMFLFSCASLEEQWNKLTPDEQARIIMDQFQGQLDGLFDSSKAFVTLNPKYNDKWKKEIVPAFKVANEGLGAAQRLAKDGNYTPEKVYAEVAPLIKAVKDLLISIGAPTEANKLIK